MLVVVAGFLVYRFTADTVKNRRPLGGPNVNVTSALHVQSEASFAVDPRDGRVLFGATNDTGGEVIATYASADGGSTWARTDGPVVAGGSCARGEPRVAIDGAGRQYLAFLVGEYCGDDLTPYLAVSSRAGAGAPWSKPVRVAPQAWKYGFDDGPALALDARRGGLYLAWLRSMSSRTATVVVSSSRDGGRTWAAPVPVADALVHPHLAAIAAVDGAVYVAGIDEKLGVWAAKSADGGHSFGAPRSVAPLRANPAGGCSLSGSSPLPREQRTCAGPNPSLSVGRDGVYVVYADAGANGSGDVFVSALDRDLKPRFRVAAVPAESSRAEQFFPVSAIDASTGRLWACWYDTTFDPEAKRAWFTCAASRDGRTWGEPLRAAAEPTAPGELLAVTGQSGLWPAVVAAGGVAHAFWTDGRVIENEFDVFTAAIAAPPS